MVVAMRDRDQDRRELHGPDAEVDHREHTAGAALLDQCRQPRHQRPLDHQRCEDRDRDGTGQTGRSADRRGVGRAHEESWRSRCRPCRAGEDRADQEPTPCSARQPVRRPPRAPGSAGSGRPGRRRNRRSTRSTTKVSSAAPRTAAGPGRTAVAAARSRHRRASRRSSSPANRPQQQPEQQPEQPTTIVSAITIFATCRGVAPLARSNASSRRRCRTDSPIVAETTSAITTATIPPKTPDMMISGRLVAIPRVLRDAAVVTGVRLDARGRSGSSTSSRAEVPAAGKTPSASGVRRELFGLGSRQRTPTVRRPPLGATAIPASRYSAARR